MTREDEVKFMKRIEELVSGKTGSIGPEQGEALLGVRKEFLRREMTI